MTSKTHSHESDKDPSMGPDKTSRVHKFPAISLRERWAEQQTSYGDNVELYTKALRSKEQQRMELLNV